jgi:phosphoglycerate dehydrogenase-like enzyme
MLLMMALLRKLPRQIEQFSHFERNGLTGAECLNKNLLVVGVGRIGSEIVRIGQGLGMNVTGVDIVRRFVKQADFYRLTDQPKQNGRGERCCVPEVADDELDGKGP